MFATAMERDAATILCIDDEQTALQLRQTLLESVGYKVLTAKSGALGIQMFKSAPVHAVVLDYWMADMNGMQVAREIRKLNPSIPIIILSAYGELLDESLGIADLWIRKGEEDPQYLLARLHEFCTRIRGRLRPVPSPASENTQLTILLCQNLSSLLEKVA